MDISKIKIGSTTYDIKDTVARNAMTNGTHFIGKLKGDSAVSGAALTIADGDAPSIIETSLGVYVKANAADGQILLQAGDMVIVGNSGANAAAPKEFIWDGAKFSELGSTGSLKDLAFKDSATGSVTAAGSNAASSVSFSGTTDADFITGVDAAAVAPSFTEGAFSAGTLPSKEPDTFSAGSLPTLGAASTSTFATEGVTASYTEASETLELTAAGTASAVTAQGTFSQGSLPSFTEGTFSAGSLPSKAADTFTAGSAATFSTAKAITGLGTATAAAQTFTGSAVSVTVA
jgi:hypothetical protein